jgi:type IV pilus assembly protein PilY1
MNMRPTARLLSLCAALGVAALLAPRVASAQPIEAGVNATPSAVILFDTSGSMEWLDLQDEYPVCLSASTDYPGAIGSCPGGTDAECGAGQFCDGGTCAFERSRYHAALEVLTGTIPNYYAICDDRTADGNRLDQTAGNPAQGIRHSIACSYSATGNTTTQCYRTPNGNVINPPDFRQLNDGLIDLYGQFVQFGFMAYDSFPEPQENAQGMFSYGHEGWLPDVTDETPIDCPSNPNCWNLGGRGPNASEGALVAPLDPDNDTEFRRLQINTAVQNQILSVVPYWSTPIESILEDALTLYAGGERGYYSWYGANVADTDVGAYDYSRGLDDPYLECRDRYVILITDGLPTYDECIRRGYTSSVDPWDVGCEGYWYADAAYYAERLLDEGVRTFVIAFNLVAPPGGLDPVTYLDGIATAGGTDQVYFADGSRELLFQLGDILTQIAEGTPSRTRPATTNQLAGDRLGQYRFEANFTIEQESKYWSGNVLRSGRECEDGALVPSTTIDAASLINDRPLPGNSGGETGVRTFYTTSPRFHSCAAVAASEPDRSPFPGDLPDFDLGTGPINPLTESFGVTPAENAEACQIYADGRSSAADSLACERLDLGTVGFGFELSESDTTVRSRCLVELDIDDVDSNIYRGFGGERLTQAQMFVRWMQGWSLTELFTLSGFGDEVLSVIPANFRFDPVTGIFPRDRTSRMADVFHSAPAIIGAPDPFYSADEGYAAFAEANASRPSTLYVGTNDGLLHAFDSETLEERWAFLPSMFQPRIGEWIVPGHTFLWDGTPVIGDFPMTRTVVDGAVTTVWKTLLLSGMRGGGRGYVAMDITDPAQPKFLWELDATLDPQMGYTYGEPDMGSVLLAECIEDVQVACERTIAVLPGGLPPDSDRLTSNIGRLVYVVDMTTGQVLRRITHFTDIDGTVLPFPAPISGSVGLYDGFGGTLVTRAFFGDDDGRLYRLNLSSGNPADWSVDLFFDPQDVITPEIQVSQSDVIDYGPVRFRPTIAPYNDYRAVVTYGMGDPDNLDDLGDDRNFVLSLIETPVFDSDGTLTNVVGKLNWAVALDPYEKLTSRPRVFNRRAYFATFVPNAADLCDIGGSRIYAFDFAAPDGLNVARQYIGGPDCDELGCFLEKIPGAPFDAVTNPLVPYWDQTTRDLNGEVFLPPKSIVFSLDIVQAPSCFLEESYTAGTRGESSATSRISGVQQGAYELQIGVSSYTEDAATGVVQAVSEIRSLNLESPAVTAIPASWTQILE